VKRSVVVWDVMGELLVAALDSALGCFLRFLNIATTTIRVEFVGCL